LRLADFRPWIFRFLPVTVDFRRGLLRGFFAMSTPEIEAFIQELRQLLEAEYARGSKDTVARLVQAAEGGELANGQARTVREAKKPRLKVYKAIRFKPAKPQRPRRAPVGAADALIKRVLSEHKIKGAGAQEIMEAATTPNEKSVSYSGIRFALDRGRQDGAYRNKDGRWFLAPSEG
jgi:hypothetical protein